MRRKALFAAIAAGAAIVTAGKPAGAAQFPVIAPVVSVSQGREGIPAPAAECLKNFQLGFLAWLFCTWDPRQEKTGASPRLLYSSTLIPNRSNSSNINRLKNAFMVSFLAFSA